MEIYCKQCWGSVPYQSYWVDNYIEGHRVGRKQRIALLGECSAQQSVQLTALRRWLAVSFLFNLVLLAMVMFTIGGN